MENDNISILHLSDLHISQSDLADIKEIVNKLIEDVIRIQVEENIKVNYICFTGDLIKRGDFAYDYEKQIDLAIDNFIYPLLSKLNIEENNFFIVPGNHEVDRTKIDPIIENGLKSMLTDSGSIKKYISTINLKHLERILYFDDFVSLFNNDPIWKSTLSKTYIRECNNFRIGFACFNTAWRSTGSGKGDLNNIILGEKEIEDAHNSIKDCQIKIALMHHPSYWFNEEDKFVCDPLLSKFDVVLNGHLHRLDDKSIIAYGYSTVFSSCGSIFPLEERYNGYSLICINPFSSAVRIYLRKYYGSPRKIYDKSLFNSKDGYYDYQLNSANISLAIGYKLIYDLKDVFLLNINKSLISNCIDKNVPTRFNDIFVQPVLKYSTEYEKEKNKDNIDINVLIQNNDNLMFIGKKESGKTTILQYIALKYLNEYTKYYKTPFIIDLKYIHTGNNIIEKCMLQFLLENTKNGHSIKIDDLNELLSSGSCIILFDNLMTNNQHDIKILSEFILKYPDNRFIFAAYENSFNILPLKEIPNLGCSFKRVFIQTMTKNSIRNLVQKWVGETSIDIDQFLDRILIYFNSTGMPRTPLLVSLMLAICSKNINFVPINEATVMERFMEILLEKISIDEFASSTYDFKNKEDYLSFLAWKMAEKNQFYFYKEEYLQITLEYHKIRGFDMELSKFDTIFFDKNILVNLSGTITFRYQCMIEYYIAKRIRKDTSALELILNQQNYLNYVNEINYLTGLERDCIYVLNFIKDILQPIMKKSEHLIGSLDNYDIKSVFDFDVEEFIKDLKLNELSDEQRDTITDKPDTGAELDPKIINKNINFEQPEIDIFINTVMLLGKVIKNSEDLEIEIKKDALNLCIKGYCIMLGAAKKVIEEQITNEIINNAVEKIEMSEELKNEITGMYQDILKITTPMILQNIAFETLGTTKLATVIRERIENNNLNEFEQFMHVFLYSDLRLPDSLKYIETFLKNSNSRDIINISLFKLIYYHYMNHFRNKAKNQLESIIADNILKIKKMNKLHKSDVIGRLKKLNDDPKKLIDSV